MGSTFAFNHTVNHVAVLAMWVRDHHSIQLPIETEFDHFEFDVDIWRIDIPAQQKSNGVR